MNKIFGIFALLAVLAACNAFSFSPAIAMYAPPHFITFYYMNISPASPVGLLVNQSVNLSAQVYDSSGTLVANSSANATDFSVTYNTSLGTLGAHGKYTAIAPGTDNVQVTFNNGIFHVTGVEQINAVTFPFVGNLTPINITVPIASSISVQAPSSSLTVGQDMQMVAYVYDRSHSLMANSSASPSEFSWGVSNSDASITSNGVLSAVSPGPVIVTARYSDMFATVSSTDAVGIAAVPSNSGGNPGNSGYNGGGTGGGPLSTALTMNAPCAGQQGSFTVEYLGNSSSGDATVKIDYLNDNGTDQTVFNQAAPDNAQVLFTPPQAGSYIAMVSLGYDQQNTNFEVAACPDIPVAPANATNGSSDTPPNAQPGTNLVSSKTVTYPNGFIRVFEAYQTVTSDGTTYYTTKVTIQYRNNGSTAMQGFNVTDSVPLVLASASQITFEEVPAEQVSGNALRATWNVNSLAPGQTLDYTYSLGAELASDAQYGSFAAPGLQMPSSGGNAGLIGNAGDYISAAMVSFTGASGTLYAAGAVAVVLMVALGAYLLVFSRKPEPPMPPMPGQPLQA